VAGRRGSWRGSPAVTAAARRCVPITGTPRFRRAAAMLTGRSAEPSRRRCWRCPPSPSGRAAGGRTPIQRDRRVQRPRHACRGDAERLDETAQGVGPVDHRAARIEAAEVHEQLAAGIPAGHLVCQVHGQGRLAHPSATPNADPTRTETRRHAGRSCWWNASVGCGRRLTGSARELGWQAAERAPLPVRVTEVVDDQVSMGVSWWGVRLPGWSGVRVGLAPRSRPGHSACRGHRPGVTA
jgi:hypothetical protein